MDKRPFLDYFSKDDGTLENNTNQLALHHGHPFYDSDGSEKAWVTILHHRSGKEILILATLADCSADVILDELQTVHLVYISSIQVLSRPARVVWLSASRELRNTPNGIGLR